MLTVINRFDGRKSEFQLTLMAEKIENALEVVKTFNICPWVAVRLKHQVVIAPSPSGLFDTDEPYID